MTVCLGQHGLLAADSPANATATPAPVRKARVSTVAVDPDTGKLVRVRQGGTAPAHTSAGTRKAIAAAREIAKQTPSVEREEIHELIESTAKRHGVDPELVHSVIRTESNYQQKAISPKGALGLMQLIPSTAARFGVDNPFDAGQNLEGGIRYLKFLTERFDGNLQLALAAYNAGEGAVTRYGGIPPYRETQNYVTKITRNLDRQTAAGTTDATSSGANATSEAAPGTNQEQAAAPRQAAVRMYTDSEGRLHLETIP